MLSNLSRWSQVCNESRAYFDNPLIYPFVSLFFIESCLIFLCSLRLLGILLRKYVCHPWVHGFFISATLGCSLIGLASLLISFSFFTGPTSVNGCETVRTRRFCNLLYIPLNMGWMVYAHSFIGIGYERYLLAHQIEMERIGSGLLAPKLYDVYEYWKEREFWNVKYSAMATVISIVFGYGFLMELWRQAASGTFSFTPHYEAACRVRDLPTSWSLAVFLILVALVVGSAICYSRAKFACSTLLTGFATAQYQISLAGRAQLRYTVTLNKILAPILVFQVVMAAVGMGFLVMMDWMGHGTDGLTGESINKFGSLRDIIGYVVPVLLVYPPVIFYLVVTDRKLRSFYDVGPKLDRQTLTEATTHFNINNHNNNNLNGTTSTSGPRKKKTGKSLSRVEPSMKDPVKEKTQIPAPANPMEVEYHFNTLVAQWNDKVPKTGPVAVEVPNNPEKKGVAPKKDPVTVSNKTSS